jgi:hypothetical protein
MYLDATDVAAEFNNLRSGFGRKCLCKRSFDFQKVNSASGIFIGGLSDDPLQSQRILPLPEKH